MTAVLLDPKNHGKMQVLKPTKLGLQPLKMKVVSSDGWVYFLDAVSLGFGIIERYPNDMQKRHMLRDKYPNLPYMKITLLRVIPTMTCWVEVVR